MIGKTTDVAAIANGDRMNAETLWAMGRIGGAAASPDGNTIVYQVGYYSVKQNKSHQMLYTISADGKKQCALTTTTASETDATWIDGGKRIAFLTYGQLWSMNADGTDRRQLTKSEIDIEGYIFSPDEKKRYPHQVAPLSREHQEEPRRPAFGFGPTRHRPQLSPLGSLRGDHCSPLRG